MRKPLDWTTENEELKEEVISMAEKVLKVMIENGLTQETDRKAVYLALWKEGSDKAFIHKKIGSTFPSELFGENCKKFSLEKIIRMKSHGHSCSMLSRDPNKNLWGGAIKVVIDGEVWYISVSGLKEWEDQTLCIAVARHIAPKYVRFMGENIQEILRIGEEVGFEINGFTKITAYTCGVLETVEDALAA
jgi:hypothetical protein